jgi:ankyrin repeat protein
LIFLATVCLLVSVLAMLTWRAVRQVRLDRALIAAIEDHNVPLALSLLERGADGQARELAPEQPSLWSQLLDRLRGRKLPSATGPSALAIVMQTPYRSHLWYDYTPSLPLVRALLQRGADPNAQGTDGYTALMYAAVYDRPDLMCKHQKSAQTCLAKRLTSGCGEGTSSGLMQLLMDHGANPNVRDDSGEFLLLFFERESKGHVGSYLFSPPKPGQGKTLLICLCERRKPSCVKVLVDGRADVNARGDMGQTALMEGVEAGDAETVKLLLDHHADWRSKDAEGGTALQTAQIYARQGSSEHRAIVGLLKQAGATW